MVKARVRRGDVAVTQGSLPEDVGRRIVASILDGDKFGRLKVLIRGYSKEAIASYQERASRLTLLQFASLVGNVQAGKCTRSSCLSVL